MATHYKEAPRGVLPKELQEQEYVRWIATMYKFAEKPYSQGCLPERFAPEPSKLHPSLEGKVRQETITIGGKTSQELLGVLAQNGINVGSYARSMMESSDFITLKNPTPITLVRLHVRDLGIKKNLPTTDEIYGRVQELGLELCPAEVGPQYRLQYKNQSREEWFAIGMKQITDSDGDPGVFGVGRGRDGLWLGSIWARPVSVWFPGNEFVFSFRTSTPLSASK